MFLPFVIYFDIANYVGNDNINRIEEIRSMSSAGHIFDMISRLKNNRIHLAKRSYFETMRDYKIVASELEVDIKRATKEEMAAIRKTIEVNQRRARSNRIKSVLLTVITSLVVIWLLIQMIWIFFKI